MQTMKSLFKAAVVTIILLMPGLQSQGQTGAGTTLRALPVSMITLLAEPVQKGSQRVKVSGYLVLDFEGKALYLHREDYQEGLTRNAIGLSLTPEQEKEYKGLGGSYVAVEASFQNRRDPDNVFTGVLFNVVQIRKTLSPHDGH